MVLLKIKNILYLNTKNHDKIVIGIISQIYIIHIFKTLPNLFCFQIKGKIKVSKFKKGSKIVDHHRKMIPAPTKRLTLPRA